MAESFFKGCFIMGTRIWIGFALIYGGCHNFNVVQDNKEVSRISIKELVSAPPEKEKWVEVKGVGIKGSLINEGNTRYLLIMDPETKMAVFVASGEDSSLGLRYGKELTVNGMAKPFDKPASFSRKKIPADVKVANLVIRENATPPGWFLSWGLVVIGLMILPPWEKAGEKQ